MQTTYPQRFVVLFRRDTQRPRLYFALVFFLANAIGAVMEWQRGIPILLWLDVGMAILAIAMTILSLRRSTMWNAATYLVLLAIALMMEIETQMHDPVGSFDDPRVGYATYLIMLLSVLFFPFGLRSFLTFWVAVFAWSVFRYSLSAPWPDVSGRLTAMSTTSVPPTAFFVLFFAWWRRLTGQVIKQRHDILVLQQRLRVKERQSIYSDMHNFMGADLTNLLLGLDQIPIGSPFSLERKEDLRRNVLSLISSLQAGISRHEDLRSLCTDPAMAIKRILIRRYSYSGRTVRMDIPALGSGAVSGREQLLLSVLTEIITNDIKYGLGDPLWQIAEDSGGLSIRLDTWSTHAAPSGAGSVALAALAEAGRISLHEARDPSDAYSIQVVC